ncbi:hypothetical protein PMAYCL1PPCAC_13737, partial [Pristionchus mayeri]
RFIGGSRYCLSSKYVVLDEELSAKISMKIKNLSLRNITRRTPSLHSIDRSSLRIQFFPLIGRPGHGRGIGDYDLKIRYILKLCII